MPTDGPLTTPNPAKWIVLIVLALMGIPVTLALVVFPMLSDLPFESVHQLDPADVRSLSVRLLNRSELDGGDDVGPYFAAPEDYAALLAPLRHAPKVADFPDARGPWLGEYRVRTTSGRGGTIRLYWVRSPEDERALPAYEALYGGAAYRAATAARHLPAARLRFQIGDQKFEGYAAVDVIRAAEAGKDRGRAAGR